MQADEKEGLSLFQQAEIAWDEAGNLSSYGSQVRRIEQALRKARQEGREQCLQICRDVAAPVIPLQRDTENRGFVTACREIEWQISAFLSEKDSSDEGVRPPEPDREEGLPPERVEDDRYGKGQPLPETDQDKKSREAWEWAIGQKP